MLRLAIICGGPSLERGVSLNSARSLLDHLPEGVTAFPIYVDQLYKFYEISSAQLYSNTPLDFDFKLQQTAKQLTFSKLKTTLQSVDLVFPVIHGVFGEDGQLQALLESLNIPFVGSSTASCQQMFHKFFAAESIKLHQFNTFPHLLLTQSVSFAEIRTFFEKNHLERAILKPAVSGSSIGVTSVATSQECFENVQKLLKTYPELVLEPFCTGQEFTVLILENQIGAPVALLPTEISTSYDNNQIFDYRKKYLPTAQVFYHTPPRFLPQITQEIQKQAEKLFSLFNMRDFARIDGWVMPDHKLYFTDFNPISGLEQNSFLFRQTAVVGMNHCETLTYILKNACRRYGIDFSLATSEQTREKKPVYVLFGGDSAERQVSLMSGTNVWLKLLQSNEYQPTPFLLEAENQVWQLTYKHALNHTVEEVQANCRASESHLDELNLLQRALGVTSIDKSHPVKLTLDQFAQKAQLENAYVFLALHGGVGENGVLQKFFEEKNIAFNGSDSHSSALCMDKFATGLKIQELENSALRTLPKKILSYQEILTGHLSKFWNQICIEEKCQRWIIKPRSDGCSTGIVLLESLADLELYAHFLKAKVTSIPPNKFKGQKVPIEMPSIEGDFLLEPFIETDLITIQSQQLHHIIREGWIELTVGVLEKAGQYHALNPSLTVLEGSILSLEEKFQGGTGINITPPPTEIFSNQIVLKIKLLVEKAAETLQIKNYARLDIFFNLKSEEMILIEANTLPALTPSTVIYQQALAEQIPIPPRQFLEFVISHSRNL